MGEFSHGDRLRRLPLRALVAFASRCARRIQSQYVLENDHPTKQTSTAAINAAIRVAEEFAMGGAVDVKKAATAARDAEEAFAAAQEADPANSGAIHAAKAALAAVGAANISFAVRASKGMGKEVWAAVEIAGESMIAAMSDEETASRALAFDLETLAELELGQFPDWGETIDPMEDGPLGPLTPPKERRKIAKPTSQPGGADSSNPKSSRTLQALERMDALQSEIEDDDPDAAVKKRMTSSPRPAAGAGAADDDVDIGQLQKRLQKELERVLAAKTALDEERIQLQTERESFESRLKKTSGGRGDASADGELRKLAKERRQLLAERQVLEDEQAALNEELQQFEIDRAKHQQDVRRLQKDREKLEFQRTEQDEQRDGLQIHRDRLKRKFQQLRELRERDELGDENGDAAALWKKLRPVQRELRQMDEEQSTLKSELESLQQSLAQVAQNGGASTGSDEEANAELREHNARLETEAQQLRDALTRIAAENESRLEAERKKLKAAQDELAQRAETFQENEAALREALIRITDEQNRFAQQQSELEKLKTELESQKQAFHTEQSRFQDLIDVTFRR